MRSDVELMLKAKAGSTVAFDWLVKRHFKPVVQFFYWRLWDKNQAEDLAQEVFIKLFQSLANYDPRGQFKSYLFSIATNHLRDHMRRVRVRPGWVSLSSAGDDDDGDLLDQLTGVEMPPEANLELDETSQKLAVALTELPEDQYLVFTMHKHEGMKYEEIAEKLGIKLGTVKSRMNTVYQHLRRAVFGPEQQVAGEAGEAAEAGETAGASSRASGSKRPSKKKHPSSKGSKRGSAKRSGLRKPDRQTGKLKARDSHKDVPKPATQPPEPAPADDVEIAGDGLDDAPAPPQSGAGGDGADGDGDEASPDVVRERAASEVSHGDDAGA